MATVTGLTAAKILELVAELSDRLDALESAPTNLNGLSDVVTPSPTNQDLLQWNGSNWVNIATLALPQASRVDVGAAGGTSTFEAKRTNANDQVLGVRAVGDTVERFVIDAQGKLLWGPGNAAVDTNLSRSSASVLSTDDAFRFNVAGNGILIREGTNAVMGVATLVAGTVVVATNKVTANSRIFLMCNTQGGTPGFLRISARTAGTNFTILSSSATDTSVVAWLIVEPA